jgi:hypothetical protein
MASKSTDKPDWRLAGDLDNPNVLAVLNRAESGTHLFVWLGDRLFVFKRTVADEGNRLLLELVEGACIRHDERQPAGQVCFTDPASRAGYSEEFVWRNKHHYETPDVGLRPDVERLFFEGFMERARTKLA